MGVFQQTYHCAVPGAIGRLREGAGLVKGLVVLSPIMETGLAGLALVLEVSGLVAAVLGLRWEAHTFISLWAWCRVIPEEEAGGKQNHRGTW